MNAFICSILPKVQEQLDLSDKEIYVLSGLTFTCPKTIYNVGEDARKANIFNTGNITTEKTF